MKTVISVRSVLLLLLLSGLALHDFFTITSFKFGMITITYLRVILVITIPLLIMSKKNKIRMNDGIGLSLLIFLIYGLTRIDGNYKQAFVIYCPLVAFYFLYTRIDNYERFKKCIDLLAFIFALFCIVGLFEIVSGIHFGQNYFENMYGSENVKMLAVGMYYNVNDFSAFLSVMIFYMLLSGFKIIPKAIFIGVAGYIIALNGSESCLLGLLSYLLIVLILKKKNRALRTALSIMVLLIFTQPIIGFVESMINRSSRSYRFYMYAYGIKNCLTHMWFGTGIGNYERGMIDVGFIPYGYASTDPHNLFLEIAGEFGIIWSFLVIMLIIRLLIWLYRRICSTEDYYYFGLVYIIPFVGLASSSCLEKNYIYLALLAPTIYYRLNKNKKQSTFNLIATLARCRAQSPPEESDHGHGIQKRLWK